VNKRAEHYLLAIVGMVIVVLAGYIQWSSMDLARYSIRDYIDRDLSLSGWWKTIGIPFCVGVAYTMAAIYGLMNCSSKRCSLALLGACFAIAGALALVSGFGYFALIVLVVCMVLTWRRTEG
jgi:uncharacterized BrkB/YihY/UPF0761 family membrane protein